MTILRNLVYRAPCGCWFAFAGRIQLWHAKGCVCGKCGGKVCICDETEKESSGG